MKNLSVADGLFVEIEYVLSEGNADGEVRRVSCGTSFWLKWARERCFQLLKALQGKKVGEPFCLQFLALTRGETSVDAIHTPKEHLEVDGSSILKGFSRRGYSYERRRRKRGIRNSSRRNRH